MLNTFPSVAPALMEFRELLSSGSMVRCNKGMNELVGIQVKLHCEYFILHYTHTACYEIPVRFDGP